jgi:hypothetical protein
LAEFEDSLDLVCGALDGGPPSMRSLVDLLSPLVAERVTVTLWQRRRDRNVWQEVGDLVQDVFVALFQSDAKALRVWDPARGMPLKQFVGMLSLLTNAEVGRGWRTLTVPLSFEDGAP